MEVQINAPHGQIPAENMENLRLRVEEGMVPFQDKLTRVEVFLKDNNAGKGGVDKHCSIEARPRGLKPVAVTHDGTQISEAIDGAIDKLHRVLDTRFGKLDHRD